jgi:hypothetical protein
MNIPGSVVREEPRPIILQALYIDDSSRNRPGEPAHIDEPSNHMGERSAHIAERDLHMEERFPFRGQSLSHMGGLENYMAGALRGRGRRFVYIEE